MVSHIDVFYLHFINDYRQKAAGCTTDVRRTGVSKGAQDIPRLSQDLRRIADVTHLAHGHIGGHYDGHSSELELGTNGGP